MKISTRIMNMSNSELSILVLFGFGLVYCLNYKHEDVIENFNVNKECPNTLIRKGRHLYLTYNNKPKVPGVNPVKFDNLEEYAEFVQYQKQTNKTCPVLYLQETETAQGGKGLRVIEDPLDPSVALRNATPPQLINPDPRYVQDARKEQNIYNQNMFSGADPQQQDIGVKTPLDDIVDSGSQSANPMAKNWGGHAYTLNAVKNGRYEGRTREGSKNPFIDSQFYSRKPKIN
jgi:hypothetical protein